MSTFISESSGDPRRRSLFPRIAAVAGALFLAIFLALTVGVGGASAADLQCGGIDNVGGQGISCSVTVVNNLDLNDPTQTFSTVTLSSCAGFAGPVLGGTCGPVTTTTTTTTTLTTSVDQCNGSGNGGGGVVYCTVDVLNQITGTSAAPVAATVNECIGSATGVAPVGFACDTFTDPAAAPPAAVTTDPATATVVQCGGSGNTDGSVVDCSVATGSTIAAGTILPVTVNQCNGSGNGNGGVVICRVRINTVNRLTSTVTSYSAGTATFTPLPSTPANNLAAPQQVVVPAVNFVPPITPVVTPPVVTPPVVTPPVTPPATVSTSRNRLASTGSLASTGADPAPMATFGILLLLFGTASALTSRLAPRKR
ncbi:MAG: hypothetical protein ABJA94_03120 [Rhodoglobus sp.]